MGLVKKPWLVVVLIVLSKACLGLVRKMVSFVLWYVLFTVRVIERVIMGYFRAHDVSSFYGFCDHVSIY